MKVKTEKFICDSCKNKSICKFSEEAKKVVDAYDAFVSSMSISEDCSFHLTEVPILCSYKYTDYRT